MQFFTFLIIYFSDASNCLLDETITEVEENATCELTDKCVGIKCCVAATSVPVNFWLHVEVDACKQEVYIQLERLHYTIPFDNYTWGMY